MPQKLLLASTIAARGRHHARAAGRRGHHHRRRRALGHRRSTIERLYARVLRDGTLGVGESYVDGWWDCDGARSDDRSRSPARACADRCGENWVLLAHVGEGAPVQPAGVRRAFEVGAASLRRRQRSLRGDARPAHGLHLRLLARRRHAGRRAGGQAGSRLPQDRPAPGHAGARPRLRLGRVRGVRRRAIRRERRRLHGVARAGGVGASEHYGHLPIDIRLDDYRNATGTLRRGRVDRAHGARRARRTTARYMELAARCLAPGGVVFIHTIGGNRTRSARSIPGSTSTSSPTRSLPSLGAAR